jgi:hypothetical protein
MRERAAAIRTSERSKFKVVAAPNGAFFLIPRRYLGGGSALPANGTSNDQARAPRGRAGKEGLWVS